MATEICARLLTRCKVSGVARCCRRRSWCARRRTHRSPALVMRSGVLAESQPGVGRGVFRRRDSDEISRALPETWPPSRLCDAQRRDVCAVHLAPKGAVAREVGGADLGAGMVDEVGPVEARARVVVRVDHLVRHRVWHLAAQWTASHTGREAAGGLRGGGRGDSRRLSLSPASGESAASLGGATPPPRAAPPPTAGT